MRGTKTSGAGFGKTLVSEGFPRVPTLIFRSHSSFLEVLPSKPITFALERPILLQFVPKVDNHLSPRRDAGKYVKDKTLCELSATLLGHPTINARSCADGRRALRLAQSFKTSLRRVFISSIRVKHQSSENDTYSAL